MESILVVDDDLVNRRIAQKILSTKYAVTCVESGEIALDNLRNSGEPLPNLILLDYYMPGMSGFEVIDELKADDNLKSIPVIFLTANNEGDTELEGFRKGAVDFITKPFIADVMMQRITRILDLDRLQRDLQSEVERQTKKAEDRRKQMELMFEQVIKALVGTIDAKDRYTNGHSLRVAEYSREILRRFGATESELLDIYYMGLLHDIGKIGISNDIINNNRRLTDAEYEEIKKHPNIGASILQNISAYPAMVTGAKWHHERYDGKGYPDGLIGDNIPFEARIIGVADAYDAMTSYRSYRDALPQEIVRQEIIKGRGSQFDPQFADIMLAMIDDDIDYNMREKRD